MTRLGFLTSSLTCYHSNALKPSGYQKPSIILRHLTRRRIHGTFLTNASTNCVIASASEQVEQRFGFSCGHWVKVTVDVTVYHVPKMKEGIPMKDRVGRVIGFCDTFKGQPITANYPIVVQFEEPVRFTCHFSATEIQLVEDGISG
eukprot:jgi/Galph1/1704/GphlegSOOS_G382.1